MNTVHRDIHTLKLAVIYWVVGCLRDISCAQSEDGAVRKQTPSLSTSSSQVVKLGSRNLKKNGIKSK